MPGVNTLSIIILLQANKRSCMCDAPVAAVWYDEVVEIGVNDEVYQKGKMALRCQARKT